MGHRIASLVGITDSGDLVNVGLGSQDTMSRLLTLRQDIRAAGGKWQKGKSEMTFRELYLLANNTAGGELKARLKF